MQDNPFKTTWELQLAVVKRQQDVDSFCEACAALPGRDRRRVESILRKRANDKTGARELWSKSEMRACYDEMRNISPKLATIWRRLALSSMEAGLSRYHVRLNFQVLADSLDCWMLMEDCDD